MNWVALEVLNRTIEAKMICLYQKRSKVKQTWKSSNYKKKKPPRLQKCCESEIGFEFKSKSKKKKCLQEIVMAQTGMEIWDGMIMIWLMMMMMMMRWATYSPLEARDNLPKVCMYVCTRGSYPTKAPFPSEGKKKRTLGLSSTPFDSFSNTW